MILSSLIFYSSLSLTGKYYIDLVRLDDAIPEEVAIKGELELDMKPTNDRFKTCVPRESKSYSKAALESESSQIFENKELKDFKACKPASCAFNFLDKEVSELAKSKNDDASKKSLFFRFVDDRAKGTTGVDPRKSNQFFRSSEKIWGLCGAESPFQNLIDDRPAKKVGDYRFAVVKYKSNMRPTVRLLQGKFFEIKSQEKPTLCYGEALNFATHYDIDRAEVWSWQTLPGNRSKLVLEIRHRVDLLNTWARRLSKPSFVKQHEQVIDEQIKEAAACLEGKK